MPVDPSVPTGRKAIREAVNVIRRRAHNAANNAADDLLCCWQFVMAAGHEHVQQMRVSPHGEDSTPILVSVEPGVADHVAGFHPNAALYVARLLETISHEAKNVPDEVLRRAVDLAQLFITDHRQDECDDDCPGWHHITEFPKKEGR
jgi:hypothetical protein